MGNSSERIDMPAQMRARALQASRGGRGADAKNFIDGIPKSAFFLAGFLSAELLPIKRRKKR